MSPNIRIDVHFEPAGDEEVAEKLRRALLRSPRQIPTELFYDEYGSRLFEEITELPEYYQTRTERALLATHADRIVAANGAEELVELGSGAATKTRLLLDAMARAGRLRLYVPFDVSEEPVRRVAAELAAEYPGLAVHGVVGDFLEHLGHIPEGERRLVVFLGGTIGNLRPADAAAFLADVRAEMTAGDHLLLGTDLIKDTARVEAAYNDARGVTAEFNRNILRVVNRLTGGDFDPEAFAHRAFYNAERHWIEMRLVALSRQRVSLPALDLELEFAAGEEILTEISTKYDRPRVEELFAASGFRLLDWLTDPEGLFALSLAACARG